MKRAYMLGLLLVILIPVAIAADGSTILDKYVPYNHTFTSGDSEYKITASNTYLDDPEDGKVLLRVDGEGFIIDYGTCNTGPFHEYCFENRSFDEPGIDIDAQGKLQPALKLKLTEFEEEASLTASRTAEFTEFQLGDVIVIEIELVNEGDIPLLNMVIHENIPETFEFVSADTFIEQNSTGFSKLLNLYPDNTFKMEYRIRALAYNETRWSTNVTYDIGTETGLSKDFGSLTLTPIQPYEFTNSEFTEEYERGKKERFTITLTNKENEPLTIDNLEIIVSPSILVSNKQNLETKQYNVFVDQGTIEPDETIIYFFDTTLNNVGNHYVKYKADLSVKGNKYVEQGQENLSVTIDELTCFIDILNTPTAGEFVNYDVTIENNDDETFYEIAITVDDTIDTTTRELPNIAPEERRDILSESTFLPFNLEEQSYPFTVTAQYRTVDQQYFICSQTVNVTAAAASASIDLTNSVPSVVVNRSEDITVTSVLRNLVSIPLNNIRINYTVAGVHYGTQTLSTLSDIATATQAVRVPAQHPNATAELVIYLRQGNTYQETQTILLEVQNPYTGEQAPTIEAPADLGTNPTFKQLEGDQPQEEDLNFFQKIGQYLRNFFN